MKSISRNAFVALLALTPLHASAQLSRTDIEAEMSKISHHCLEYASVMADVKWRKYNKLHANMTGSPTGEDYSKLVSNEQQQCVSVENILLMQMVKSLISTDDAAKMKVDKSIEEQMSIIERTL